MAVDQHLVSELASAEASGDAFAVQHLRSQIAHEEVLEEKRLNSIRQEKRDVAAAPIESRSTPKHEQSSNLVIFMPNILGMSLKKSNGETVRLQKNNSFRYYENVSDDLRSPDQFAVLVGITDEFLLHVNADDKHAISYEVLFDILKSKGYDPLKPLRDKAFQDNWEKKLGAQLIKCITAKRFYSTADIKAKLLKIGRIIRDICRDYIIGGVKPPLEDRTVQIRNWKAENYPSATYQGDSGEYEPLFETGRLCGAISVEIETYTSRGRIDYVTAKRKIEHDKNARRLAALRKKTRKPKEKKKDKPKKKPVKKGLAAWTITQLKKELSARIKANKTLDERHAAGIVSDSDYRNAKNHNNDNINKLKHQLSKRGIIEKQENFENTERSAAYKASLEQQRLKKLYRDELTDSLAIKPASSAKPSVVKTVAKAVAKTAAKPARVRKIKGFPAADWDNAEIQYMTTSFRARNGDDEARKQASYFLGIIRKKIGDKRTDEFLSSMGRSE